MAIRHALDGQVERKHMSMEEEKVASLRAEQQVLGYVAQEMQEARYRAFSEKKEQAAALRSTWAKQQQLKLMEAKDAAARLAAAEEVCCALTPAAAPTARHRTIDFTRPGKDFFRSDPKSLESENKCFFSDRVSFARA
jgi:hypothetical protein